MARQADGSVVARCGDTIVLAAACHGDPRVGIDFFPLTVDYREKMAAAGKIPGSFFKREGRPTQKEILTMRLTDRSIRPLFPKTYKKEVQVCSVVLSADNENDPDILSMIAASASLCLSSIPFGPAMGAVRIGYVDGKHVVNPTQGQSETSLLDLVVAGTSEGICMVEAGAKEVSEKVVLAGLALAEETLREICAMIDELVSQCGKEKQEVPETDVDAALADKIRIGYAARLREANVVPGKLSRSDAVKAVRNEAIETLVDPDADDASEKTKAIKEIFYDLETDIIREGILAGKRADGRGPSDIREITCEVGLLPRAHGSALFTRGETQSIVTVTLGTRSDEQKVDGLMEDYYDAFMLHYNFPPWSVNETKMIRGPGRREIGHGALAERSLRPVLPDPETFPYTVRVVSDVLESNGSSSQATVCGATLSLMDAGVPLVRPVAGIAMGLVVDGDKIVVLSDILGSEDHCGDMDLKVAGSQDGITALQMDIKMRGISQEVLTAALQQAHEGRMHILDVMLETLGAPRPDISEYAPKIIRTKINPEKIGMVIGPGGKIIKGIQDEYHVTIEIEDDGTVSIFATCAEDAEKACAHIEAMTEDITIGRIYDGRVTSVKDFGAFVEILPGQEGLCHISELSTSYVEKIDDVVKMGDELRVKVLDIDDQNRVRLSRKAVIREEEGGGDSPDRPRREGRRDGGGGPRRGG